ncbi:MAG: hypothetical protein KKA90_00685 [Nanoarchaeota archaeon]|nr:hypothetical protein [Nanoarchaeota archaeon]
MKTALVGMLFLLVVVSGCIERPVSEDDFEVVSLDYVSVYTDHSAGLLQLVVNTNIDNLQILATSSSTEEYEGCSKICEHAGSCQITSCIGDPMTGFIVRHPDVDRTFQVCAVSGRQMVCKDVFVPGYQES